MFAASALHLILFRRYEPAKRLAGKEDVSELMLCPMRHKTLTRPQSVICDTVTIRTGTFCFCALCSKLLGFCLWSNSA